MKNKEYIEIKKDYQEMKEKYTQDEIIESLFIAIRVIDKMVGDTTEPRLNNALKACEYLCERVEKLESEVLEMQKKIDFLFLQLEFHEEINKRLIILKNTISDMKRGENNV